MGCCILIRAAVFQHIGLIREDFFMDHEEVDFCLRAQRNGWKTLLFKRAQVVHPLKSKDAHRRYLLRRNLLLLARSHKRLLMPTLLKSFGVFKAKELLFQKRIAEAFRTLKERLISALASRLKSLKPMPRLDPTNKRAVRGSGEKKSFEDGEHFSKPSAISSISMVPDCLVYLWGQIGFVSRERCRILRSRHFVFRSDAFRCASVS